MNRKEDRTPQLNLEQSHRFYVFTLSFHLRIIEISSCANTSVMAMQVEHFQSWWWMKTKFQKNAKKIIYHIGVTFLKFPQNRTPSYPKTSSSNCLFSNAIYLSFIVIGNFLYMITLSSIAAPFAGSDSKCMERKKIWCHVTCFPFANGLCHV